MTKLTEELISQWHPTKNGNRSPLEKTIVSRVTWWLGTCGHEWDTTIFSRLRGYGCPICSGRRVLIGFNDLASDNPELAKEWHPTKNGDLTPFMITAHSGRKDIWWQCKVGDGHEWISRITDRNKEDGDGCPVCSGRKILSGFNDLRTLNPELAAEWHPTMNSPLTPDTISPCTHESAFWLGKICGHTWPAQVKSRHLNGNGCQICSGHKVLAGFNDLASQSPLVAAEWHPTRNGTLAPQEVGNGTHESAFWLCKKGHEWSASIGTRTGRGDKCPYCSNRKILIGYNDLASTHPLVAAEWHPTLNRDFTPYMAGAGMNRKSVHWICKKGHEWYASIGHRSRGVGCPICNKRGSKPEDEIFEFLTKKGFVVKQSDRTLLRSKEIDLYLPENDFAIEFNGVYWHTEERGKGETYHYDKWLDCKNQGVELVQIWEDDWMRNKEVILKSLLQKLVPNVKKATVIKEVKVISETMAQDFITTNSSAVVVNANVYVGSFDSKDILSSVATLNTTEESVTIVSFVAKPYPAKAFGNILDFIASTYPGATVTFVDDNCFSFSNVLEEYGFVATDTLKPDFMHVSKRERLSASSVLATYVKLTNEKLPRIWDAGKTIYIYQAK
jgi:G:T-mismatch repair DNA endonuclease (very short patch repair protein)